MPTGYRYNGVDLEDILERTKDSSTDTMTNFDTTKFRQGAGLLPLDVFVARNISYDLVSETTSLKEEFVQDPPLINLVLKGGRPRFVNYTWSLEKYGNSKYWEGYFLAKGTVPSGEIKPAGEYLIVTHRNGNVSPIGGAPTENYSFIEQELFSKSDLGLEFIPKVIFFEITGGGGGGGGGSSGWLDPRPAGGGGSSVFYGYIPIREVTWNYSLHRFNEVFYNSEDLDYGVFVGKRGSKGESGSNGSDGGDGKDSFISVSREVIRVNGGRGGESSGNGGAYGPGGYFYADGANFILQGIDGGNGSGEGQRVSESVDFNKTIEDEQLIWTADKGAGYLDPYGGGGGASRGNGGDGRGQDSGSNGVRGGGGGGGRHSDLFLTKKDGYYGGNGVVTFFY